VRVLLIAADAVDDVALTHLLRARTADLEITSARSLRVALESDPRSHDVILLDLAAAEDGIGAAIERILARDPDAAIVALTDDRGESAGEHAVGLGAQDYVVKNAMTGPTLRRVLRYARARKAALQASETRYRRIIEASLDAVICTDAVGVITDWNPRAETLFGWSRLETIGKSLADTVLQSSRLKALHSSDRALCPAMQALTQAVMTRKDGSVVHVELTVSSVGAGRGRLHTAFIRDITERHRAEERLLAEKAFANGLIDSMPGVFALVDPDGRILRWNASLSGLVVSDPGVDRDRFLMEYVWPEDRNRVAAKVADVLNHGQGTMEVRLRGADGSAVPFFATAVRIVHEGRPCMIATGMNLSERRAMEHQLAHAQKLESVGRLAGAVAHDFNNMLAAVMSFAELVLMDSAEDDPRRADVQTIHEAATRAVGLTRQLLAFSRRQVFTPRVVELNSLVTGLDKMLRRLIGEDIELVTMLGDDAGSVMVDPGQIESALLNLAVNARDAMPSGGTLTLVTSVAEGAGVRLARLTVADTGTGMSEQTLAHIYEPFFTTKEPGKGTGLGLASVHSIVKQSHGAIGVHSRLGEGTRFTIDLPHHNEPAPVDRTGAPAKAVGGTETILLAEDNDLVRHGVAAMLGARGYTVLQALNGQEAVRIAIRHPGPIHLLLSDVVMPMMPAPEMLAKVRSVRPDTAVLLMSGYVSDAVQAEIGEVPFIQKPFTSEALALLVREVLDGVPSIAAAG
jgi:two-component system cell cycle sensor histidine kinase/response regulator CckA